MDLIMQTKSTISIIQLLIALIYCLFIPASFAGTPVWTFTPDSEYPGTITISPIGTATIRYVVTNQSTKSHTLTLQPIAGISQVTSGSNCASVFTLGYHQSCTLELSVTGSQLTGNVVGGPVVCQQGSTLQCYEPSSANALNITLIPIPKYTITPSAGANGSISPDSQQTITSGGSVTFTATPNTNYDVDQWIVDSGIAQKGGTTFTLSNITANHSVTVSFALKGMIYAGTAAGNVYISSNNGASWTTATGPSTGNSVNSIFALPSTLYAGSADGKVYYSSNNGTTWSATAAVPGATAVNSVYVQSISSVLTIFAGTQNGNLYYTTDGATWTATASPGGGAVNCIYITSANVIYVGCNDGNVYYSNDFGAHWNKINGPTTLSGLSIHNIFVTSSQIYIGTHHISTNSTLPANTVDFEYAYSSNSLTSATPTWTILSQLTYSLYVNADASLIHAGTQDGYIFSLTTGDELGFVAYSPITSLFFLG